MGTQTWRWSFPLSTIITPFSFAFVESSHVLGNMSVSLQIGCPGQTQQNVRMLLYRNATTVLGIGKVVCSDELVSDRIKHPIGNTYDYLYPTFLIITAVQGHNSTHKCLTVRCFYRVSSTVICSVVGFVITTFDFSNFSNWNTIISNPVTYWFASEI